MKTAVALAGGVGDLGLDDGEQDDLFEAECEDSLSPAPRRQVGPKGGRPLGARNKSTELMRQLFLRRYPSPLMGCGEIYSRPVKDLARELGLTREVTFLPPGHEMLADKSKDGVTRYVVWDLERALRLQMEARATALPYVHQKLPQAVTVEQRQRGVLIINGLDGADAEDAELLFAPQQNQQVSEAEVVQSHDVQSHADDNPMKYKDE